MAKHIMILDGYNILHRIPRWVDTLEQSLELGREQLLGYCRAWMQGRGDVWLFCVVFDGDSGVVGGGQRVGAGIRVFFSRSGQSADDRLLAIVDEFGPAFSYTVVSDDHYVRDKARLLGAAVLTCKAFAGTLSAVGKGRSRRRGGVADGGGKVGPADAARITDELRRLWVQDSGADDNIHGGNV